MTYQKFLNRVIEDGIQAAKDVYTDPKDIDRLKGSIAGFEACRGKSPTELSELRVKANSQALVLHSGQISEYWFNLSFDWEVSWVCNCVSATLANEGLPTIVPPTYHGLMKAAEILETEKIKNTRDVDLPLLVSDIYTEEGRNALSRRLGK